MKKLLFALACLASGAILSSPAHALWIYQQKASPFDGGEMIHFAITSSAEGYALELQCRSAQRSILYLTPKAATDVSALNFASPRLLVSIDGEPVAQLDAKLDLIDDQVVVAAQNAGQVTAVFDQISTAGSQTTVAVQLFGETMHETDFSIGGSVRAIERVNAGCEGA